MQIAPTHDYRDWVIDLPDGMKLHGDLRGEVAGKPVAVVIHGLPGNGREGLYFLGSAFLNARGLTTLSVHLYDYGNDYRDLVDTTIATHATDLISVVAALRQQGAAQVFAVGHSYGGLTIIRAAGQAAQALAATTGASERSFLDGAVLWDPTHGCAWQGKNADWMKDYPQRELGEFMVMPKGMIDTIPARTSAYNAQLGDNSADTRWLDCPTLIISAADGSLTEGGEGYLAAMPAQRKKQVVIEGAGHCFDNSDATMEKLFSETHTWLAAEVATTVK